MASRASSPHRTLAVRSFRSTGEQLDSLFCMSTLADVDTVTATIAVLLIPPSMVLGLFLQLAPARIQRLQILPLKR